MGRRDDLDSDPELNDPFDESLSKQKLKDAGEISGIGDGNGSEENSANRDKCLQVDKSKTKNSPTAAAPSREKVQSSLK